ncbi:GNS1/SUR4 membrane protein [Suillus decipiens]|nr:GNS1/SUR4 membrane protein [Suillus decipiens]
MTVLADFLLTIVPKDSIPTYLKSYIPGETPLSTWPVVTTALASYLAIIFGIREIMKDKSPQRLNTLFRIHNAFLSIGSLILLVLMMEEVGSIWLTNTTYGTMCDETSWTERLEFYYMINYYFKYIELFDTVFLALKKKPLAFLHVFHHSATALLCFVQLNGKTSVSWVVISLNLAVHVIMYYYYFATAGGAKIWWKKYLTSMQIVQFILPHWSNCAGTETAALFGCGLLTTYLGLFINFYIQTYKKSAKGKRPTANGVANGHAHNGNSYKKD